MASEALIGNWRMPYPVYEGHLILGGSNFVMGRNYDLCFHFLLEHICHKQIFHIHIKSRNIVFVDLNSTFKLSIVL